MPRLRLSKRSRWLLLPAALLALPVALKVAGVEPTNRARTDESNPDVRLHPRIYTQSPEEVRREVLALVPTLSKYGRAWRVVGEDAGLGTERGGSVLIRCEVPVLVFTDDLTITIRAEGAGARAEVESAARVGNGDMGENARHIRQLLAALDERLGASAT